jgi:hypothetical protein
MSAKQLSTFLKASVGTYDMIIGWNLAKNGIDLSLVPESIDLVTDRHYNPSTEMASLLDRCRTYNKYYEELIDSHRMLVYSVKGHADPVHAKKKEIGKVLDGYRVGTNAERAAVEALRAMKPFRDEFGYWIFKTYDDGSYLTLGAKGTVRVRNIVKDLGDIDLKGQSELVVELQAALEQLEKDLLDPEVDEDTRLESKLNYEQLRSKLDGRVTDRWPRRSAMHFKGYNVAVVHKYLEDRKALEDSWLAMHESNLHSPNKTIRGALTFCEQLKGARIRVFKPKKEEHFLGIAGRGSGTASRRYSWLYHPGTHVPQHRAVCIRSLGFDIFMTLQK